jgi:hypothetical protein
LTASRPAINESRAQTPTAATLAEKGFMQYTRADIEQAEARLAEAGRRVAKQRTEVEKLRAAGMPTAASETILASMEDMVGTLRASVTQMLSSRDRT